MNIHILGICGTLMGGVALLARSAGHRVSGSDQNVYPPMSTQLQQQGIKLYEGYAAPHIEADTDLVVIGNSLSRGNPVVEFVLNEGLRYISGPRWLGEHLLRDRIVLAVAGTHGKTTTASMLAWILERAGLAPGFLIGGVCPQLKVSARVGEGAPFVVEADEYDTAFFDKRSKFVHYHPQVLVLNNLEFDHADIFPDLGAIKTQFHHLLRTIPGKAKIICNGQDAALAEVLARGCWSSTVLFGLDKGNDWYGKCLNPSVGRVLIGAAGGQEIEFEWELTGEHNLSNAVAAVAAAAQLDVDLECSARALVDFKGVTRRVELMAEHRGIMVYNDFAHHPTAILNTLMGLRSRVGNRRILAVLEPRSNSMRSGAHSAALGPSLSKADGVLVLVRPELQWDVAPVLACLGEAVEIASSVDALLYALSATVQSGDVVVFMSNGGFEAAPQRFVGQLIEESGQ